MLNSKPQEHTTWGILIIVFAVLSIFGSAMGGFGVGLILGIIGGILAMAWQAPATQAT
jgi:multisubunit Na+/H+ antiporter MnhG subunit